MSTSPASLPILDSRVDDRATEPWVWLLIAVAIGLMCGRVLSLDAVDRFALEQHLYRQGRTDWQLTRPFLSANDRSRWATVRALVEEGTYAIDNIVADPLWDTIDMVQHRGRDGQLHLYSSKPPLMATLLAGEYWLIYHLTGASLRDFPFEVGRFMLLTFNVLPLAIYLYVLARMSRRFTSVAWSRMFFLAAAAFGTLLTTFATSLNNHTMAAVCVALLCAALAPIWYDGRREPWRFFAAGLVGALAVSMELPALSLFALVGAALLWLAPRPTLIGFAPGALIVAAAALGTNYAAHGEFRPAYSHRTIGPNGLVESEDDWYLFTYERAGRLRQSYWHDPVGVDRGEPSIPKYVFHCTLGHHGIFSLTPIWLLSLAGPVMWLRERQHRALAVWIILTTLVCFAFYMTRPTIDRNYGGVTCGLRWMFWFAPLWLLAMLPTTDRMAGCKYGRTWALTLLALSVLSASYPTWNPWTSPWLMNFWEYVGLTP